MIKNKEKIEQAERELSDLRKSVDEWQRLANLQLKHIKEILAPRESLYRTSHLSIYDNYVLYERRHPFECNHSIRYFEEEQDLSVRTRETIAQLEHEYKTSIITLAKNSKLLTLKKNFGRKCYNELKDAIENHFKKCEPDT